MVWEVKAQHILKETFLHYLGGDGSGIQSHARGQGEPDRSTIIMVVSCFGCANYGDNRTGWPRKIGKSIDRYRSEHMVHANLDELAVQRPEMGKLSAWRGG